MPLTIPSCYVLDQSWKAEEDSVVITVRWPQSQPLGETRL
jgi:hypothetical protein